MREAPRTTPPGKRLNKKDAANKFYRKLHVDIAIARGKSPEDPDAPLFSARRDHQGRISTVKDRTRGSR